MNRPGIVKVARRAGGGGVEGLGERKGRSESEVNGGIAKVS